MTEIVKNKQKNFTLIVKKGIDFFNIMWYDVNDILCTGHGIEKNFMEDFEK